MLRNNFGGSIGGPIVKNKAFFFFNTEQFRDREDITLVVGVPTLAVRQGIVPTGLLVGGVCTNTIVTPNPDSVAILNLYPQPNGPVHLSANGCPDGTQQATNEAPQKVNDAYYLGRFDQQISEKQSLFARYLIQSGNRLVPSDNGYGVWPEYDPFRSQLFTLGHKYVFSNKLLNQFTLSFSRSYLHVYERFKDGLVVPPQMFLMPGFSGPNQQGEIEVISTNVNGLLPPFGGEATGAIADRYVARQVWEADDQISYNLGQHFLQAGIQGQKIMPNENDGGQQNGQILFPTLLAFVQGKPSQFSAAVPGTSGRRSYRQFYVGTYLEDSYKVKSNLTLNVGLRWEFLSNPTESHGLMFTWVPGANGIFPNTPTVSNHPYTINRSGDFAPRIGFAWNVFGNGHTSVRGGFGMYYNQLENEYRRMSASGQPFYNIATFTTAATLFWPNPGQVFTNGTPLAAAKTSIYATQTDPHVPTLLQYNLTVQQEIARGTLFSVGYVGNHGYHQVRTTNPQIPAPFVNSAGQLQVPSQTPMNPVLNGTGNFLVYDANSSYNSLQTTVERRFTHGLQVKGVSRGLRRLTTPAILLTGLWAWPQLLRSPAITDSITAGLLLMLRDRSLSTGFTICRWALTTRQLACC